jgi:hypothetical protein
LLKSMLERVWWCKCFEMESLEPFIAQWIVEKEENTHKLGW